MKNKNIIDFQNIVLLKIVQRPSKVIISPYVADAIDKNGKTHLVHTPALSLADQCITDSQIFATPTKSINSKTLAEKEAWSLHKKQSKWQLVVINPSLVLGPFPNATQTTSESINLLKQIGDGTFKIGVPKMPIGVVDVRDVADANYEAAFNINASV